MTISPPRPEIRVMSQLRGDYKAVWNSLSGSKRDAYLVVSGYTDDAAVAAICVLLFQVAAALQIGDGIQVAAAFALRGFKDTRMPLLINATTYWGIGFVLAYALGIHFGYGAEGVWIGLTTALWTAGALLITRLVMVSRTTILALHKAT